MKSERPNIPNDPMFKLLRVGDVKEFNRLHEQGKKCDLRGTDLRGSDLRGLSADGLDLSNCYLRQADLRGVDFSNTPLEGASIHNAQIGGTFFPRELSSTEIRMSYELGTRMRYGRTHIGETLVTMATQGT
ncbi:MAG: pentapeptide repeat-containing protein [bacterium]